MGLRPTLASLANARRNAAASRGNPLSEHVSDIVLISLITVSCITIELLAPVQWRPELIWLMLAPGCGLIFGAIPALLVRRRNERLELRAREQQELVGLLLKDYAAERSDWLWSIDIEGNLRGVNEKLAAQMGQSIGALEGKPFVGLLRGKSRRDSVSLSEMIVAMRQRKPFFDLEMKIAGRDGPIWWRLAGKPVFRESRYAGYVGTASNITAELKAKENVNYLAFNDGLTGLNNRSYFTKRLGECVSRLERYGTPFAVLYLDLDKFKAVNDTRGHRTGDQLLIEVGRRLKSQLRETDIVARLGGDEFSIILPEAPDANGVSRLAERLITEIEKPFAIEGDALIIGLSIGVALAPLNGRRPDQILHNADLALYRSKGQGGNRFSFFESEMDAEIRERSLLEHEMVEAIERNEFVFHYQPQVSCETGMVCGLEALIRWKHPRRGILMPSEFIPIAERSALISTIGAWTLQQASQMLARLPARFTVAVNLSTKHIRTVDVAAETRAALQAAGIDPARLHIEFKEELLAEDTELAARKLNMLRSCGVTLVMDDLGAGPSALSSLLLFPVDRVKIDRSFIAARSGDGEGRAVLNAVIGLARSLKIAVSAEGLETEAQVEFVKQAGCDVLQGFYFATPMSEANLFTQMAQDARREAAEDKAAMVAA